MRIQIYREGYYCLQVGESASSATMIIILLTFTYKLLENSKAVTCVYFVVIFQYIYLGLQVLAAIQL